MPGSGDRPAGWRFDFEAADTAATEVELAVQALREFVALLEQDVPVVTEDWLGRFREVFDVDSSGYRVEVDLLAEDLQALATSIRAKAVEAAVASM
jgi:hypothetical protein